MEASDNWYEYFLGKKISIFVPGTESYKFNVYLHWFEYTIRKTSPEYKREWIERGAPLPVPEFEGKILSIKEEFISEVPEELKKIIERSNGIVFFIRDFSYLE